MKVYIGERRESGEVNVTVGKEGDGCGTPLPLRLDLYNHSPTGFEWGYAGSGTAQLALAICADALGDDRRALRVYQHFKDRVFVSMDDHTWSLTEVFVMQAIREIEDAFQTLVQQ